MLITLSMPAGTQGSLAAGHQCTFPRTATRDVACCSHEALANPRHACRYAGEPAGSRQARAQPSLHNGSQSQPAAALGNSPARLTQAETDTASSERPGPAQSPVDNGSQPQPGADQGNSPGAPPLSGADTAGSQASASFVAGPQAGDVQVSILNPCRWHSIWSRRTESHSAGVAQRREACGLSTKSKTTEGLGCAKHLCPRMCVVVQMMQTTQDMHLLSSYDL